MFAPEFSPLKDKYVRALMKGKYVHINNLFRQRERSKDPHATEGKVQLAGDVSISFKKPHARKVTTPLEWLEAFLSSVLPAQLTRAQQASTSSSVSQHIEEARRSLMYALYAMVHFKNGIAPQTIEYLEAHRRQCIIRSMNMAYPDWNMKLAQPSAAAATVATAPSHSNVAGDKQVQVCGLFNKPDGCYYAAACKFLHICRLCKQSGHRAYECPKNANHGTRNNKAAKLAHDTTATKQKDS
jgi:hypothetical protein